MLQSTRGESSAEQSSGLHKKSETETAFDSPVAAILHPIVYSSAFSRNDTIRPAVRSGPCAWNWRSERAVAAHVSAAVVASERTVLER